jgi:NADPH2:quinone reductase
VRIHAYGGPEQMRYEDVEIGSPQPGEAFVRHTAIGVNFADLHNCQGRYPLPSLPHTLGGEAVGIVEEIGPGVTQVKVGDRVAYAAGGPKFAPGSYAQGRMFPAERLIPIPKEIDDITAAALFTKGITAQYLIKSVYPIQAGETILVHAAAGGVGLFIAQWAAHLGVRVIGIVSSEEKAEMAKANGCQHVLLSNEPDIPHRVRSLTGGRGVPVVFDSVGKDTFDISLKSLRPQGLMVSYGSSSGRVPPFDIFALNGLGSLSVTSAAFAWFVPNREELLTRASEVIDVVLRKAVKIHVCQQFALKDAELAHRAIESRKTIGSTVLIPE